MPIVLAEIPPFVIGLAVVGFIIVSLMMMLVVLIQRPQGGGLSGAFGASSDGAGQTAFGARTGDALTIATITIFVVFLLISIGLNYMIKPPEARLAPTLEQGTNEPSPAQPAGSMPVGIAPETVPPASGGGTFDPSAIEGIDGGDESGAGGTGAGGTGAEEEAGAGGDGAGTNSP